MCLSAKAFALARAASVASRAFNAEGRVIRREDLAGQATTTAWDFYDDDGIIACRGR